MAYIGRDVQYGTLEKQDLIADGSQTVFTLNYGVTTAASLIVSVGGVIQEPDTAYTVSGTQLTFTAAPDAGSNVYVVFLGKELIDMEKLPAAGTSGNVLTSDGTNWTSQAVSAGGVDGITSSAAGTAITLNADNSVNMGNQPYFLAQLGSQVTLTDNTFNDLPMTTLVDSQGTGYNTGTGVYTAPVTGKYLFTGCLEWDIYTGCQHAHLHLDTSNQVYQLFRMQPSHANMHRWSTSWGMSVHMDAGDTAKIKVYVQNASGNKWVYHAQTFWAGQLVA